MDSRAIVVRELREKRPQGWYYAGAHAEHHEPLGAVPEAVHRHALLADPIGDCQAVLVANIDDPSREHLETIGVWPVVVHPDPIDVALQAFLAGMLVGEQEPHTAER